jgi:hypothetical protein
MSENELTLGIIIAGKSVVITKNTPQSATGGYYCNVCDCVVKVGSLFFLSIKGTTQRDGCFFFY